MVELKMATTEPHIKMVPSSFLPPPSSFLLPASLYSPSPDAMDGRKYVEGGSKEGGGKKVQWKREGREEKRGRGERRICMDTDKR
jgi:hypothetical protein